MSTTTTVSRNGAVSAGAGHPADGRGQSDLHLDPVPGPLSAPASVLGAGQAADLDSVLTAVRHNALALCADADRPPARLRVAVGAITVELSWAPDAPAAWDLGEAGWLATARMPLPAPAAPPAGVPAPRTAVTGVPAGPGVPAGSVGTGAVGATADPRRSAAGSPPVPAAADAEAGLTYVTAPSVGVFYHAPEPGARPFVRVGDMVRAGQQVAILEVMKLMIPIEADTAGRVVEVCHPDATSVEYGERLFAIAPAGAATTTSAA
ncbi:MAG: acetyl-CoA carboxylase biotin carboxyl carrier protein subunit [Frankia sp.]|nr:acetyl-CoA carboxylase biotin carboxyl carrier protein subunit [Frankia sp.]